MIDIDETLKLTQGQGHKVKDQGHIRNYVKLLFSFKSWMGDSILMILLYLIDIDERFKLTQGQGHKITGHGHIRIYVKIIVSAITHDRMNGSWCYLDIWWILMKR